MSKKTIRNPFRTRKELVDNLRRGNRILDAKLVKCSDLLIKTNQENLDLKLEVEDLAESLKLAVKYATSIYSSCHECPISEIDGACESDDTNERCIAHITDHFKEAGKDA